MDSFNDLSLAAPLLRAATDLGFTQPSPVQAQAIPAAIAGHDLLVSAKTGSGKTAAFLLPLLHCLLQQDAPRSSTRALILLPTRELAIQTQKNFEQLARFTQIKAGLIIGGEAFKHQIATLRRNPEVVIATPGRLVEHINNKNADFNDLEILVLDEADRMLDMGFAESMHEIVTVCNEQRQNLFFSATLKHRAINRITAWLKDPVSIEIGSMRTGHENIQQQKILADDLKHKQALTIALCTAENAGKIMVFCNTRAQCQQLSNLLQSKKIKCGYLHGEVGQNDRKQILNRFRDDTLQVLVATDVAARGLDIDNVDLVVNFTVAHSGDEHIHRIGRTGRADQIGRAITLVCREDWNLNSSIERYLKVLFQTTKIAGLEAEYKGPKKLKSSGKAVGRKKKKDEKGKVVARPKKRPGTRSGLTSKPKDGGNNDGMAPLRKK